MNEMKQCFIDWIIANTEPCARFNDFVSMIEDDLDISTAEVLKEHNKTLEQFKSELIKELYELLRKWNKNQPKKRRDNEYWIRSFNKSIYSPDVQESA